MLRSAMAQEDIKWLRKEITVMGRKVMQPREIAYMADNGQRYTYSRTQLEPVAFPARIAGIKREVERISGASFNCCLLNHYRDGKDHLGWHSDNERFVWSESHNSISIFWRQKSIRAADEL